MNISGIILVLFAAYLIIGVHYPHQQHHPHQQHGSSGGGTVSKVPYTRQYNELDDVDHVLSRPIEPGNKITDSLVAYNTGLPFASGEIMPLEAASSLVVLDNHAKAPGPTPASPIPIPSQDIKVLVEARQPSFLKEALIIDGKYYHDQRYPQRPVSVEFAKDPERFVREHPDEYPSYVIKSRMWTPLKGSGPH